MVPTYPLALTTRQNVPQIKLRLGTTWSRKEVFSVPFTCTVSTYLTISEADSQEEFEVEV